MSANSETMQEFVYRPAMVGGVGAVGSLAIVSSSDKLFGLPAPVSLGLIFAASSMASAGTKNWVYENVLDDDSSELAYNSTAPILTGASAILAGYLLFGSNKMDKRAHIELFVLGSGSEMVGAYIDENILGEAIELE